MTNKLTYFPGDLADELAMVARADGLSGSEVVCAAVDKHLLDRQADRGLPESLHRPVLDRKVSSSLPDHVADELDRVASIDGVTTAAAIREAVRKHVADRKSDPEFRRRITAMLRHDVAVARRIAPQLALAQQRTEPAARA